MDVQIHPAANFFPMMTAEEMHELKNDLCNNGLLEPVVFWCDQLLDGRNRLQACREIGLPVSRIDLDKDTDPVAYVLSHNLHRRHLSSTQKAMVAGKVREFYDDAAKERHAKNSGRPSEKKPVAKVPQVSERSRDAAGKSVGVSGKMVDAATAVLENGCEELQGMVERDEIAVTKAAEIAKHVADPAEQIELAKQNPKGKRPPASSDDAEYRRMDNIVRLFEQIENPVMALQRLFKTLDSQQLQMARIVLEEICE